MRHVKLPVRILQDPGVRAGGLQFMGFLATVILLIAESNEIGMIDITWMKARELFGMNRKAMMDMIIHMRGCFPEHPDPNEDPALRFRIHIGVESLMIRCLNWFELASDRRRRTMKKHGMLEVKQPEPEPEPPEPERPSVDPGLQRILDKLDIQLHPSGAIEYGEPGNRRLTPFLVLPDLMDIANRDAAIAWLTYWKRFPNGMGYPTSKRFIDPFLAAGVDVIEICQQINRHKGLNDSPIWKVLQPLRDVAESRIQNGGGDPNQDERFQNLNDVLKGNPDG